MNSLFLGSSYSFPLKYKHRKANVEYKYLNFIFLKYEIYKSLSRTTKALLNKTA